MADKTDEIRAKAEDEDDEEEETTDESEPILTLDEGDDDE